MPHQSLCETRGHAGRAASNPPVGPAEPSPSAGGEGAYETLVPTEDPERVIVPTAVYFPFGRENEAKSLRETGDHGSQIYKGAFRLRVIVFMPYDPKSDWEKRPHGQSGTSSFFKRSLLPWSAQWTMRKRKRSLQSLKEIMSIFRKCPSPRLKKAFYTTILLGARVFLRQPKATVESRREAA